MDRLACPYSDLWPAAIQTRGQSFLPGAIMSHHAEVGSGTLQGDKQPLVLDACGRVDSLDTCIIDFYIEHMDFTWVCLSYTGIIMVRMRVSLAKLPLQTVMGQVPALVYMLLGVRGLLQPCLISSSNECFPPLRLRCRSCLSDNESPRVGRLDTRVPPRSG
jgi:hypothetical protein